MKKFFKLYLLVAVVVFGFTACEDAAYDVSENKVLFSNAEGISKVQLVVIDTEGSRAALIVKSAYPVSEDVTVTIDTAFEQLESYNERWSTDYSELGSEFFTLATNQTVIKANQVLAEPIYIDFKPLSEEMVKSGLTYALPLKIKSVDKGIGILENSSTFIFAATSVLYTDVPTFQRGNSMMIDLAQDLSLPQFTIEYLFRSDNLGTGVIGNSNNQIHFNLRNSAGGYDVFTRFGDTMIESNCFQLQAAGVRINSQTRFKANTWYHMAYVHDGITVRLYVNGVEDSSQASNGSAINLDKEQAQRFVGESQNDSYTKGKTTVSEMRIWSIPRTADQIANTMYGVRPSSEGLELYLKMNEGTGNLLKDATENGNSAHGEQYNQSTIWTLGERIEVGQ